MGPDGRAVRRPVPRRPRRVDGRDGPAVDRIGARAHDVAAAVDRVRVRPGLRRLPAARWPHGGPAGSTAGAADRARGLHRRVRARGPRQRRHAAGHHALPQGRGRRVHGSRRAVDHHDPVRRGPGAQPRAEHLHRHRRERVLARSRGRRPADRAGLALDLPAAGADRDRAAGARAPLPSARPPRGRSAAVVRHPGRRDADRRDAAVRAHDRRGARSRAGPRPRRSARSVWRRSCWRRSSRSSAAPAPRWCASASCAPGRWCARTSA